VWNVYSPPYLKELSGAELSVFYMLLTAESANTDLPL
jgi:hypothetical protein